MKRPISVYVLAIIGQSCIVTCTATRARNKSDSTMFVLKETGKTRFFSPVTLTMRYSKLESLDNLTAKCKQIINFLFWIIYCAATVYRLHVSTHLGGSPKYHKVFKMETK